MKSESTIQNEPVASPPLWRGLEEYMESPEFRDAMVNEFPEDASDWIDPVSRRNFLTIMGASLALAGAGCSPRPASQRKIVPYTRQPEQMVPGVPLFFASACPLVGYGAGVLVRSHEGRPVKIEGNQDHPSSLGSASIHALASILDLYDPDRSQQPTKSGIGVNYEEAIRAIRHQLYDDRGSPKKGLRIRILSGATTSPSLASQIGLLLNEFPETKWVQYEPCGLDNVRVGANQAFGRDLSVSYDFLKADVVLSLDADFLTTGPGQVRYSRDFGSRRKIRQDGKKLAEIHTDHHDHAEHDHTDGVLPEAMSRLYCVECMPTTTGSTADHRLPLITGQIVSFARMLASKLGIAGFPEPGPIDESALKWFAPLLKDLLAHKGTSIVIAGDHLPASVHALVHKINEVLGNLGKTVHLTELIEERPVGKMTEFTAFVGEMARKEVDAVLILGGTNPAYTTPVDVDFVGAFKNVPFRFHLGLYQDETAALCEWHINEAHYLEAWGDIRGHDGTATVQQPLIAPLYAGKSASEVLAAVLATQLRDPKAAAPAIEARDIVRMVWKKWFVDQKLPGEFEQFWQETVRAGVVKGSAKKKIDEKVKDTWKNDAPPPSSFPGNGEFELNFRPDPTLFDGRYANNGWLQEVPKPVTKLTWDNAIFVSPATAKKLGADKDFRWTAGERGRVEVSIFILEFMGRQIKAPVWILPGHPDSAVTIHLGGGRERAGRVGNTESQPNAEGKPVRGFNAFALRTTAAMAFANGVKLKRTADTYILACVQSHWVMAQKDPIDGHIIDRAPVRRQTIGEYKINPSFAKIPPTAAGEADPISHNIPGPAGKAEVGSGVQGRQGTSYGPGHEHGHDHSHAEKGDPGEHDEAHDDRLLPLTMYRPNDQLYPEAKVQARRWGMSIDLAACIGCNACMIACQSENNIPVVGKYEVTRAHEMNWIRVDRYYEGTPDSPDATRTYFQPVPCQQCEKAPCEIVCPVGATVHSADGLNDMAYNRCVGTRYCSNNCPYKVRRFNFLTFQDWATASLKLGRNPDVSVRSRGVMEKCTYCVQRIRNAEIVAEREHRPIHDGEVVTACQSACPTGAISFGDLGDSHSIVGKWKSEPANYGLLAELNTMPRTTYLASLRNPNPELGEQKGA